ncbi:CMRF35-like molecule 5 isoform X1 [Camelus bactrianus]|uniref:CMRF35-like molecule 5 isoform X1 n=1 Tax=Camelus bactrianus TaxID=9837 RepID=A0AC58NPM2_CAMBA
MGGRTTWLLPALLLLLHPGSAAITSPKAARGLERGSLTVQCQYSPGWELYVKWWCRGADWGCCKFFVKTTGSEQEVKKDHVSIKDNQKNRSFTVTMEKLRLNDADTYWCGIERIGTDLGVQIEVTVDPAPGAVPTTTSTTTTFTAPVTTGDTRGHPSNGGRPHGNRKTVLNADHVPTTSGDMNLQVNRRLWHPCPDVFLPLLWKETLVPAPSLTSYVHG